MKSLDPFFQQALSAESTTIAWCWLIDRTDGVKLGFTSFDLQFTIDSVMYDPQTGFNPSAQDNEEGLQNNNSQNLEGILASDRINEQDLAAGKYFLAKITCFLVDVTNLPSSLNQDPPKFVVLYSGTLGKVTSTDRTYNFEARGLDYDLEATLGELTSKFCRNEFGDSVCGVNLAPHTFTQTIASASNQYTITINQSFDDKFFDRGLFKIGDVARDIATSVGATITLFQPFPNELVVGANVSLIRGCRKTLLACAKYGGILNNQSEPHVPLPDDAVNPPIS
jgi:uncharacterized phage protein (TIGR02218 family)